MADLFSLFNSHTELMNLTLSEKKTATLLLIRYYNYSLSCNNLPSNVVTNLVTLFGSTNELFSYSDSQQILNSILTIVKVEHTFQNVSTDVQIQFLEGLFSLSPGIIDNFISKSAMIYLLETVSEAKNINALSRNAVLHLMTVLPLSNSLIKSLPVSNVSSLLTFIALKSSPDMFMKIPPSTLFSFMDNFLDTIKEPKFKKGIPDSITVAILQCVMSSNMWTAIPVHSFDRLLAVLSSSINLTKAIPNKYFFSLFSILKTSPLIIKSLNHNNLVNVLITVVSTPNIYNSIPQPLLTGTFQLISIYKPSIKHILEDLQKMKGIIKNEKIPANVC